MLMQRLTAGRLQGHTCPHACQHFDHYAGSTGVVAKRKSTTRQQGMLGKVFCYIMNICWPALSDLLLPGRPAASLQQYPQDSSWHVLISVGWKDMMINFTHYYTHTGKQVVHKIQLCTSCDSDSESTNMPLRQRHACDHKSIQVDCSAEPTIET